MAKVYVLALIVVLGCSRKANKVSGQVFYGSASKWDTIYDTLRYFVPVPIHKPETVITERSKVVLKLDTVRRVIQVGQVVKTPIAIRETTKVVIHHTHEAQGKVDRRRFDFWWGFVIFALCTAGLWLAWRLLIKR